MFVRKTISRNNHIGGGGGGGGGGGDGELYIFMSTPPLYLILQDRISSPQDFEFTRFYCNASMQNFNKKILSPRP